MLCRIADLIVEVPEAGGMAPRCRDYLCGSEEQADIIIRREEYSLADWQGLDEAQACYMESGAIFYSRLLNYDGMLLHASAVDYQGKAYLFSGPSTVGKSTHTHLWQQTFGATVQVFNDDKPALRFIQGKWYAYGTPWCGKDGINQNKKVPLAGICFLKQGSQNRIRRLSPAEAVAHILSQTVNRFALAERMDLALGCVDRLVRSIPVFSLENTPTPEAARLCYETMRAAAEL